MLCLAPDTLDFERSGQTICWAHFLCQMPVAFRRVHNKIWYTVLARSGTLYRPATIGIMKTCSLLAPSMTVNRVSAHMCMSNARHVVHHDESMLVCIFMAAYCALAPRNKRPFTCMECVLASAAPAVSQLGLL